MKKKGNDFVFWLGKSGRKPSTCLAYSNRVGYCLKQDNVKLYIDSLHGRHKYFTQSAWNSYVEFCGSNGDMVSRNAQQLFRVMKDLDEKTICQVLLSDMFPKDHPLAKGGIVFRTDQGILRLTKDQYSILSQWSGNNRLIDL